jgi:NitT/TauT family transport system substrate-binding protein
MSNISRRAFLVDASRVGASLSVLGLLATACGTSAPAPAPAATNAGSAGGVANLAVAGAAATATTSDTPEMSQVKVTFGTVSPSNLGVWVAVQQGLFKKYGLDVELILGQGTTGVVAVTSGAVQFFFGEAITAFQAVAAGSTVRILAAVRKKDPSAFLVQPTINGADDLRGKPIAISTIGDATDLDTRISLGRLGLKGEDVVLVSTGNGGARLAALTTGKVVGSVFNEPIITEGQRQGMKLLVDIRDVPNIGGGVTADSNFARANPKTVAAFLKGFIEGIKFQEDPDHRKEVEAIIASNLKVEPDDPQVGLGWETYQTDAHDPTPDVDGAQAVIDALKQTDATRYNALTPDSVIDSTYMSALKATGFLKQVWGDKL